MLVSRVNQLNSITIMLVSRVNQLNSITIYFNVSKSS